MDRDCVTEKGKPLFNTAKKEECCDCQSIAHTQMERNNRRDSGVEHIQLSIILYILHFYSTCLYLVIK